MAAPMHQGEPEKPQRLAISLTGEAADWIREFAEANGITPVEAVRRAIAIQKFIDAETSDGGTFHVRHRNGEIDRIQFVFG